MSDSNFSSKYRPNVKIHCNWEANIPEKSVEDTVRVDFNPDEDGEKEICADVDDILDVRTTVNFMKPENMHVKPCIEFIIPDTDDVYISGVTILCDSKTIEIFGDHGIYVGTLQGEIVEESEEFFVYQFTINFGNKINKEVSIHLVRLSHMNYFWIYGILLKLKKITVDNKVSSICYENVQELMKNCNLSDQATKAFNFMKNANQNQRYSLNSVKSDGASEKKNDEVQPSFAEIKQYMDYKFQILTEYLIMREKSMNDKLDRVIEMMKSKN